MFTIYANNTISIDGRHIGSYKQEQSGTVFIHDAKADGNGIRHELGRRFSLVTEQGRADFESAVRAIVNA